LAEPASDIETSPESVFTKASQTSVFAGAGSTCGIGTGRAVVADFPENPIEVAEQCARGMESGPILVGEWGSDEADESLRCDHGDTAAESESLAKTLECIVVGESTIPPGSP
jgi:hypothetical protein